MNEVIIDGCNVAECDKFCKTDNYNEPNKCWSDISESYSDCKPKEYQCLFYVEQIEKQLQRAKAENEKLKKQINDAEKYIDELQDALRDMEVQKDNIKNLKPIDITEFCKTAERVFDNSNKYKTALEDIKSVAFKTIIENPVSVAILVSVIRSKVDEVLHNVDN